MQLKISVNIYILLLLCSYCSGTCTISTGSSCVDGVEDAFSCVGFLEGELNNRSCAELGYTVGACCVRDYCDITTQFLCLFSVEGTWKKGKTCGDCPTFSSCCADGICFDDLDETTCLERGGIMSTRPCDSGYCLKASGACCGDNTCYEMPEEYCDDDFSWQEGATCEDTCYFPKPDVPPPNVSSPGRCCGFTCYEFVSDLDCTYFYEYGYGCSAYPCYPQGACVNGDTCLPNSYESLCILSGSTFIDGGVCANSTRNPCHFPDTGRCVYRSSSECDFLGGVYGEEYGDCAWDYGACCATDGGKCVETFDPNCATLNEIFAVNATCALGCDALNDDDGLCCVHNFCFTGLPRQICLDSTKVGIYDTSSDTCPSRGICGNSAVLDLINVTIENIPITINDVSVDIQASSLSITSLDTNGTSFDLKNSTFLSGPIDIKQSTLSFSYSSVIITSLNTTKSRLILDTNSQIEITGCLTLGTESTISVHISASQDEELKDTTDGIQLLSFDCVEGDADYEFDSDSDECYKVQKGVSGLFLFLDDCGSTISTSNALLFQIISLCLILFL